MPSPVRRPSRAETASRPDEQLGQTGMKTVASTVDSKGVSPLAEAWRDPDRLSSNCSLIGLKWVANLPAGRASPERAQPSLVGSLGVPPKLCPPRFPPGKRAGLRNGDGGTPTRSRGAPTNTGPQLHVDHAEMGDEAADPLHIAARATRRDSRPAGESREGAALFGGGLGVPPQPLSAPLPAREAGGPPDRGGT